MSLLALAGTNSATGYDIDNSVKLEADNTEYFSRTPGSATNRQTFTYSTWVKRAELGQNARLIDVRAGVGYWTVFGFDTSDRLVVYAIDSGVDYGYYYTPRFRDTSAWYHVVWKSDITNATAANRWQIYVNGVEVTDKDIDYGTPPTNFFPLINITYSTKIGYNTDGSNPSSQYMAETHLIDGTALAPTDFGEFDEDSGIWKPKAYEGTYGTNGFYLDFESSGSLGADSSGNGNNFTLNNITSADQATDTPTNNFCIMSPLWKYATSSTLTNGGTYISTTTAGWTGAKGSIGIQNGKWYWEVKSTNVSWSLFPAGIQTDGEDNISSGNAHSQNTTMALGTGSTYIKYVSGVESSVSTGGVSMTTNNITGVALDLDSATKTLKWFRNNTLVGTVNIETVSASFGNQPVFPFSSIYADSGTVFIEYNFGGYTTFSISSAASDANGYGTFEYAPPSGYYAL